jgi:hypothetical protein
VTVRLAGDDPQVLHAAGIGDAWLAVAGRILADGVAGRLLMVVKSAHVYETEFGYVRGVLAERASG